MKKYFPSTQLFMILLAITLILIMSSFCGKDGLIVAISVIVYLCIIIGAVIILTYVIDTYDKWRNS